MCYLDTLLLASFSFSMPRTLNNFLLSLTQEDLFYLPSLVPRREKLLRDMGPDSVAAEISAKRAKIEDLQDESLALEDACIKSEACDEAFRW